MNEKIFLLSLRSSLTTQFFICSSGVTVGGGSLTVGKTVVEVRRASCGINADRVNYMVVIRGIRLLLSDGRRQSFGYLMAASEREPKRKTAQELDIIIVCL